MAAPLTRGAGVITSLVKADGILIIPRGSQGLMPGADISVRLYRTRSEIEKTILAIGSHDMSLDILAQHLSLEGLRLASANVGSLGGLVALRRGEAHFSGSHLLDMETGEYNKSFIRQYLPDRKITLVTLVGREQGLIINKGNPKNISTINDLVRPDVHFINRQRGAGTRLLLDYHLKILGILSDSINGYLHEEFTHLSVAAGIASGRGDCGLGIAAAAAALELDFIPLYNERYDLVIPTEFIDSQLLTPVLDVINSSIFKNAVNEMPGYDTTRMGEVIYQF